MKPRLNIPGAVLLISIYCFALGMAGEYTGHYSGYSALSSGKEVLLSAVCTNLYSHLPQVKKAFNTENLPEKTPKNDFRNYKTSVRFLTRLLLTEITQYRHFSGNLRIHYRKADTLFPFQYFW